MTSLMLLGLLAAAPPGDGDLARVVTRAFEATGRTSPPVDEALSAAARELATAALGVGVERAGGLLEVTGAVSRGGGWDANPTAVLVSAAPEDILSTVREQLGRPEATAVVGLAVVMGGDERGAAVVLLARRGIELERFQRRFDQPPKRPHALCGRLLAPLTGATAFVTRPGGTVDAAPMTKRGERVCADLTFPGAGRHTVEVLADGPRGPEVVALFFVEVGQVPDDAHAWVQEPASDAEARPRLLAHINALRLHHGAKALTADAALDAVAQAWATRLAEGNFFAHVAPDGSTLQSRLAAAAYDADAAGENLGLASGPLAAHFGIEHSPGHRRLLLDAGHRRLGLGLARRADGLTVLVELLATPAKKPEAIDPLTAVYRSIAETRSRQGLSALKVSPALEAVAQAHARAALEAQTPKARVPGLADPYERAFSVLDAAQQVAVDVYVTGDPAELANSRNLASPDNALVGVGLVKGDTARYGAGRYWVVVIYASRGPRGAQGRP